MAGLQSSQNFVRTLKSQSDPPNPGGPLKIKLAEQAWEDTAFRLPNKEEVIVDWLLTKFSKEKPIDLKNAAVIDLRHWKLLSEILTGSPSAPWLKALASRIPIVPAVTSLLDLFHLAKDPIQLLPVVASCLTTLWPLGARKATPETLLSCWSTFLVKSLPLRDIEVLGTIGTLISESFRNALSHSSARRKLHINFVQNLEGFNAWIEYISALSTATPSILRVGLDALFNIEVLRSIQDSNSPSSDIPLFQSLLALSKSNRKSTLDALPQVFANYVTSLRKNKSAIFSGSSDAIQQNSNITSAALQFFAFAQDVVDQEERDSHAWGVVGRLLQVVEDENLPFTHEEVSGSVALAKNIELGLLGLRACYLEEHWDVTRAIFDCMSTLVRIDCDLVLPTTTRLFVHLLCVPTPLPAYFTFLDLLLEYHTKTRTLDSYVERIFAASFPQTTLQANSSRKPLTPSRLYALHLSSPLMHQTHLEKLARAMQQFATPSQCPALTKSTIQVLKDVQEQFKHALRSGEEEGPKKKKRRKSEATTIDQDEREAQGNAELLAVRYSLASRVAQVVLGSIPLQSISSGQVEEVRLSFSQFYVDFVKYHIGKLVKGVARESEGLDDEVGGGQVSKSKKRKEQPQEPSGAGWSSQIVLCALLRLQYALERVAQLGLGAWEGAQGTTLTKRMAGLLSEGRQVLPELVLEVSRHLLSHSTYMGSSATRATIDPILAHIESGNTSVAEMSCSGQAHQLPRASLGLVLLHLVLERWLPVVDGMATPEQLSRLANVITQLPLSTSQDTSQGIVLLPQHLLMRTLKSAQFWELAHLRAALTSRLVEMTENVEPAVSKKVNASNVSPGLMAASFKLALFVPVEYFPKACRDDLVKRALAADRQLQPCETEEKVDMSGIFRTFLEKTFRFTGAIEQQSPENMVNSLLHLLQEPTTRVDPLYLETSLDLAALYLLEIFRQCSKSTLGEIHKVLSSYTQYPLYDGSHPLHCGSLTRLVELVTREFQFSHFVEDNQEAFRHLHGHLSSMLRMMIEEALATNGIASGHSSVVLGGWHTTLALGVWIGIKELPRMYGPSLTRRLMGPLEHEDLTVMAIAIVLQEIQYPDSMQQSERLELAVATYLARVSSLSPRSQGRLDEFFGQACRSWSPSNYGYVLDLIREALTRGPLPSSTLCNALHLAALVLKEHPSGTLKITQGFFTTCINAFNSDSVYINGALELRLQVWGLLNQHCTDRPAALRLLDMGSLWLLFSKYLSPCHGHDTETSNVIFLKIVHTANALIRLRRDLVVSMLPHLGMVLKQLLMTMRRCRPQLGAKQMEMVMDTLPRWISSGKALGVEEARALSRLLEALMTKTVPRTHHVPNNVSEKDVKAESLAAAFGKHASYVLKAYIEALNEPLCVIGSDVRKELASGIYALCGMINEHSRDSLMVSALDNSGRATMKALWKEYEKQRYIGKG